MEHIVLAVIVTYNRLECLQQCLSALKNQTVDNFDILVINNGSTDGTTGYLDDRKDLLKIHQANLGGAGGFYSGMRYMFEHGYEWLWMMDDDGLPDRNQLKNLLKYGEQGELVLNAIVVNKDNPSKLAFGNMNPVDQYQEALTASIFHPFNGTFIHRSVIKKLGYIKKEMFIWGDEQEYRRRILSYGYVPKTVTSAIHFHPQEKGKKLYVFPFVHNNWVIWDKPAERSNIYYRNLGYIDATYGQHWYSGYGNVAKHLIAFALRGRFLEIYKFLKYYRRGMNNKFK